VPTLVLHRAEDARVKPEAGRYLAKVIPGARFVELHGRDHPIWTGEIDPTVDAIEEFLTGTPPHSSTRRVLAALLALRVVGPERRRDGARPWAEVAETFAAAAVEIVRQQGGLVVRWDPDNGLARFDGPARAAGCARALVDRAGALRLSVAQGLHVGEVEIVGDGIAGVATHVVDRIAERAGPGETLAFALVAELAAGSGIRFTERDGLEAAGLDRPLPLVALASEQHLEPKRRNPREIEPARLSGREREVLTLVAEGLSNAAIAARLSLSEHTVKRHVANILTKLDLPTRVAAAALVARQAAD
jgi:DNA-binding CsgD family transcriptional regulator